MTLRPGFPRRWGCGTYGWPPARGAMALFLVGRQLSAMLPSGPPGSRDRLSGRLWLEGSGWSEVPLQLEGSGWSEVPLHSAAGRPIRPVVPKTVRDLFEVEPESAGGVPAGRVPSRPTAHVVPAASSKATEPCEHAPAAKRSSLTISWSTNCACTVGFQLLSIS